MSEALALFAKGGVIPAHPLALTEKRTLDERRQRALSRYYIDAGALGLAVGVHTTQFAIHDNGMLKPVLELAVGVVRESRRTVALIAGVQGPTKQAVAEVKLAASLGYDLVLLRPHAGTEDEMIARAKAVGEVLPVVGFYLQPAVGGMVLSRSFWTRFAAIEAVVGIKVAPFDRYRTIDVLSGVAQSGRASAVTLYTGNDNNILSDLVTPYRFGDVAVRFTGGLLGQFAVWTRRAVTLLEDAAKARAGDSDALRRMIAADAQLTDANAAIFDVAGAFHGCVPGIHEVLRRQGLLAGRWCLDPHEELSVGQMEEIDRVYAAYPDLADDAFVAENLDRWLR